MTRDAELERLRSVRDQAGTFKDELWDAKQVAWELKQAAHEKMDAAFDAKQAAYLIQDAAWQELHFVRERNQPLIDNLRATDREMASKIRETFQQAATAYCSGDRVSANLLARQGHTLQTDRSQVVNHIRSLVNEIKTQDSRLRDAQLAFWQAKGTYDRARSEFEDRRDELLLKRDQFHEARAAFELAHKAFCQRLEEIQVELSQPSERRRCLVAKAGVPESYWDNVSVVWHSDGIAHIYFGGLDRPDGEGHGHYVLNGDGVVIYQRNPVGWQVEAIHEDSSHNTSVYEQPVAKCHTDAVCEVSTT